MQQKKSPWPGAIITFFAVVFIMNGFFIYKAVSGFDGIEEDNYYEKGLNYNNVIQQEKKLGWKIDIFFIGDLKPAAENKAKVVINDRNGSPVDGAKVKVLVRRPATDRFDREFELVYSEGSYHGNIQFPVSGLWDLIVKTEKGTDSIQRTFRIRAEEV